MSIFSYLFQIFYSHNTVSRNKDLSFYAITMYTVQLIPYSFRSSSTVLDLLIYTQWKTLWAKENEEECKVFFWSH